MHTFPQSQETVGCQNRLPRLTWPSFLLAENTSWRSLRPTCQLLQRWKPRGLFPPKPLNGLVTALPQILTGWAAKMLLPVFLQKGTTVCGYTVHVGVPRETGEYAQGFNSLVSRLFLASLGMNPTTLTVSWVRRWGASGCWRISRRNKGPSLKHS